MTEGFFTGLLAMCLFCAAFLMWVIAWVLYDRPVSLVAVKFCVFFAAAGAITLVVWRITSV